MWTQCSFCLLNLPNLIFITILFLGSIQMVTIIQFSVIFTRTIHQNGLSMAERPRSKRYYCFFVCCVLHYRVRFKYWYPTLCMWVRGFKKLGQKLTLGGCKSWLDTSQEITRIHTVLYSWNIAKVENKSNQILIVFQSPPGEGS